MSIQEQRSQFILCWSEWGFNLIPCVFSKLWKEDWKNEEVVEDKDLKQKGLIDENEIFIPVMIHLIHKDSNLPALNTSKVHRKFQSEGFSEIIRRCVPVYIAHCHLHWSGALNSFQNELLFLKVSTSSLFCILYLILWHKWCGVEQWMNFFMTEMFRAPLAYKLLLHDVVVSQWQPESV